jgi:hypothetical protein
VPDGLKDASEIKNQNNIPSSDLRLQSRQKTEVQVPLDKEPQEIESEPESESEEEDISLFRRIAREALHLGMRLTPVIKRGPGSSPYESLDSSKTQ